MPKIEPGRIPDPSSEHENARYRISIADDAAFRDWWTDNVGDRFGLGQAQVADLLLDGLPDDARLEYYRYGEETDRNFVQLAITGCSLGELVYLFGQTIHLAPIPVENLEIDVMDVVKHRQRQGISATLMANVRRLADLMDVRTLTVEAYLSAGPYAWLSYGFVPDPDHWPDIKERVRAKLDELADAVPSDVRERLDLVLNAAHPRALSALLAERMLVESTDEENVRRTVPLAVALMADTEQRWYGVLDLEDEESRFLLEASIERNRR